MHEHEKNNPTSVTCRVSTRLHLVSKLAFAQKSAHLHLKLCVVESKLYCLSKRILPEHWIADKSPIALVLPQIHSQSLSCQKKKLAASFNYVTTAETAGFLLWLLLGFFDKFCSIATDNSDKHPCGVFGKRKKIPHIWVQKLFFHFIKSRPHWGA